MNNPLSDLEFEILDRLYHADRRTLSQSDMLKPIGLRINEYSSALTVLSTRKLIDIDRDLYRLSDPGAIKFLAEFDYRSRLAQETARQLERDKHADELFLRENRREWIGIVVSNVIASAALILSIISLFK